MPASVRLRRFFVPASIGLMLVFAIGWYTLFWLPHRHRYLDDRNFRVLKTLSEQIRLGINNFDKMMDNAADSGITDDRLDEYLSNVAPQLEKPEDEETESIVGKGEDAAYGDPPKISVVADEGTHFLYMAFKRTVPLGPGQSKRVQYAIRTDLDQFIKRVLPPTNRNPFNIVLVLNKDGTVIFQKSSPGIEIARMDTFNAESATDKKGKAEDGEAAKNEFTKQQLPQSSHYAEVTLAGAAYRLYSQPLQLAFPPIERGEKGAKKDSPTATAENWVVCGLVRADSFRSESQAISYTYMLWLCAGILVAVAAYPFLRLHLSSPLERVHAGDVIAIAVSACVIAATLSFILLDVYYWRFDFDKRAGANMKALAEAIDDNFDIEKQKAFAQLDDFYLNSDLANNLREANASGSTLPQLTPDGRSCTPSWACTVRILEGNDVDQYPFLQLASWSDSTGNQRVKWTTKKSLTPFLNLDKDQSITYYPDVKRALADVLRSSSKYPTSTPTQGVGTQYSANTGDNITIFWKLLNLNPNDASAKAPDPKNVFCASLITHPISVFGPVLPNGFQFAVIQSDGTVVFHSDRSRNLRENFLDEMDQNQEVRSRVLMRASGPLIANYMGRPHRLYIHPMNASEEQLWTLVVFRDLHLEDTMNLEILSLSSIMYILYAAVIALGLALAHQIGRGRTSRSWFWPDSRKSRTYRWLTVGNAFAAVLLLIFSQLPAFLALLFCGILIPVGAIICNFLLLTRQQPQSAVDAADANGATSSRWQLSYWATCTTLLLVVAVMPCLCFAKAACDFEHKLITARGQLGLANDLDARSKRVRQGYQGIALGDHGRALLSEPEDATTPVFSYHQVLRTSIASVHYGDLKGFVPPTCSLGSPEGRQRCVELFFSWSSPIYDQIAADNRYLAETGSSAVRTWSSTRSGSEQKLELKARKSGDTVRVVSSVWTPLHIPLGDGRWWLGMIALMTALFGLVRWSLRRIFLLDLVAPVSPEIPEPSTNEAGLLSKLSMNLMVIGPASSSTIASLLKRRDVQAWDMQDALNMAQQSAKTSDGSSFVLSSTGDQVDEIIRDGRPLVLYNCEKTFDTPRTNHQSLITLERVLANLGNRVVITTAVDPTLRAPVGESERWRTLMRCFVRIDLTSVPAQSVNETLEQFESRISAEAYQRWHFSERSRPQKLVLVHLAQEGLVSPNSREIVSELMKEGVLESKWGLVTIKDCAFAAFVKHALSLDTTKRWEGLGLRTRSNTLRLSLIVLGTSVAVFLIYTQGEVFNTWVTYATGLAASVPAFMRVFAMLRGKNVAES